MWDDVTDKERGEPDEIDDEVRRIQKRIYQTEMGQIPGVETKEDPNTKMLHIRYRLSQRERWDQVSEKLGISVAELAHQLLNEKAAQVLDCAHLYTHDTPWTKLCLDCGISVPQRPVVPDV